MHTIILKRQKTIIENNLSILDDFKNRVYVYEKMTVKNRQPSQKCFYRLTKKEARMLVITFLLTSILVYLKKNIKETVFVSVLKILP